MPEVKEMMKMMDFKVRIDGLTHGGVSQNKGLLPTIHFYPSLSLSVAPPLSPAIAEVHLAEGQYVH